MSLTDCLNADYDDAYFNTEDWAETATFNNEAGTITAAITTVWGDVELGETAEGYVADMVRMECPADELVDGVTPLTPVRMDTVTRTDGGLIWLVEHAAKERGHWALELMRNIRVTG